MSALYVFALVLGGGLLLFSVLGELLGFAGGGADAELDVGGGDADLSALDGVDAIDLEASDPHHLAASGELKILSAADRHVLPVRVRGGGHAPQPDAGCAVPHRPRRPRHRRLPGAAGGRGVPLPRQERKRPAAGGEELFVGLPGRVSVPLLSGRRDKVVVLDGGNGEGVANAANQRVRAALQTLEGLGASLGIDLEDVLRAAMGGRRAQDAAPLVARPTAAADGEPDAWADTFPKP